MLTSTQYKVLFQDFLRETALSQTHSTTYTDCSITSGYVTLDPYTLRESIMDVDSLYGDGERYNYAAADAFNHSTYALLQRVWVPLYAFNLQLGRGPRECRRFQLQLHGRSLARSSQRSWELELAQPQRIHWTVADDGGRRDVDTDSWNV